MNAFCNTLANDGYRPKSVTFFPMIGRTARMKTMLLVGGLCVAVLASGCTDREAASRRAKEEAEAKARADASRKEMETLPKAFKSRDYFKKNEPAKKPEPTPEPEKTSP
jgi:hypothetical protein